jgi:hypothetical protein
MQFVGACASEIWPLKQLKDENSGLERMVVDLTLNRSMPAEMCLNESGQANCSPLGRRSPAGGLWHQRSLGLPIFGFGRRGRPCVTANAPIDRFVCGFGWRSCRRRIDYRSSASRVAKCASRRDLPQLRRSAFRRTPCPTVSCPSCPMA